MAVSVNDRYIRATASSSQTVFTYDFPIALNTDITILKVDGSTGAVTTLVLTTDYTLTGVGDDSGGTFVLTSGATSGDIYVAYGNTPYARSTDFSGNTEVTTDALNTDYNEEEKQIQQLNTDIARSVKIPISDDILTADIELPTVNDRKSKYMVWSSDGLSIEMTNGTTATASAGGSDTEIQYNSGDTLDGISGWTTNGTTAVTGVGTLTITGSASVDNLKLDGNTISSTSGNIVMTPNGTSVVDFGNSTEAVELPQGTTAQRPASPAAGYIRFNTTTSALETYDGSSWITQSGGSGDVTGPGSSTDNAVARFDGTGGTLLQDSSVLISDADAVTGVTSLTVDNININGNSIISTDTAGDVNITPDTTGDVVIDGLKWPQADGTAKYCIVTDGSAQLSFANRDWVALSKKSDTVVSSITFTGLNSVYQSYIVHFTNCRPVNDGVHLYLRTSTDGGSSYDSGASDYAWYCEGNIMNTTASTTFDVVGDEASDFIRLTATAVGNDSDRGVSGFIFINGPEQASYTQMNWQVSWFRSADTNWASGSGGGVRLSTTAVDAIQFLFSGGNVGSGDWTLYGLRN